MDWRISPALATLRNQIDDLAPKRGRASDGTLGDAAHAKTTSDHNPDTQGVVKAIDITHDPKNGVDGNVLAPMIAKDPKCNYTIFNRKLYSNGKVVPYTGSNPHDKHFHVSVKSYYKFSQDKWNLGKDDSDMFKTHKEVEDAYLATLHRKPYTVAEKEGQIGKSAHDFNQMVVGSPEWLTQNHAIAYFGQSQATIAQLKKELADAKHPVDKKALEEAYQKIGSVLGK